MTDTENPQPDEIVTRREVLVSMPHEECVEAMLDEYFYGRFWAERTEDGFRRVEPPDN